MRAVPIHASDGPSWPRARLVVGVTLTLLFVLVGTLAAGALRASGLVSGGASSPGKSVASAPVASKEKTKAARSTSAKTVTAAQPAVQPAPQPAAQPAAQQAAQVAPAPAAPAVPATPPTTAPPVTSPSVAISFSDAAFLACTRAHESETAGGYAAVSPGGTYRGAYQFDQTTWNGAVARAGHPEYSGTDPATAPPTVQDAAATQLHHERGNQPWGGRC
jgi:hypothetical protein